MTAQICLWFDTQAREAAEFYTRVLRDGSIDGAAVYPNAAEEVSGKPAGSEMTVEFEVEGVRFLALNGGPNFTFSEAVSVIVYRDTQEEIDEVWEALLEGGGTESQCGWLKDRFGLSWQVTPSSMGRYLGGPDREGAERAMQAMLGMRKIDIGEIQRAYEGVTSDA